MFNKYKCSSIIFKPEQYNMQNILSCCSMIFFVFKCVQNNTEYCIYPLVMFNSHSTVKSKQLIKLHLNMRSYKNDKTTKQT